MKALRFTSCALLAALVPGLAGAQDFTQSLVDAYQTNPELNAARAALRGVDEQVPQALANFHPTLSAVGSANQEYIYSHPSASGAVSAPTTVSGAGTTSNVPQQLIGEGHQTLQPYSYGLQLTQPVYRGGRTVADTSRAENAVLAQRGQLTTTEQQVLLGAATAYLDVVRDQTIVDLEVENDHLLVHIADSFQNRLRVGEISRTDVSQARAMQTQNRSSRILAQSQLATSRAAFLRYVGTMPEKLSDPQINYPLPPTIEEATEEADANNPAVLAATYTEAAARDSIDLAAGNANPEVNLIGEAGRSRQGFAGSGPLDDATVEAQLNIPLFTGGLVSSQVRQAKQLASQRLIEVESARRQARQQAVQAWETLQATTTAVAEQMEGIRAAQDAFNGSREEDAVGTKTTLDLLNAVEVLLTARTTLAATRHDNLLAKINLLASIGKLTAEGLALPVDTYDPRANYAQVHDQLIGTDISNGKSPE